METQLNETVLQLTVLYSMGIAKKRTIFAKVSPDIFISRF